MKSKKHNLFKNPFFGIILCTLYLVAVQFSYSVILTKQYMKQGYQNPNFLSFIDLACIIVLWMPFFPILFHCVAKKEWKSIFLYSKELLREQWWKFVIYFFILFFLHGSIGLGDMAFDISFDYGFGYISKIVYFKQSFGSYAVLMFLYRLFESIISLLFLITAPVLYCIEHNILNCHNLHNKLES